jgi:hypothetical protein
MEECGYSFSAHFFKNFVVIITTSEPETITCTGENCNVEGVYMKKTLSSFAQ